MNSLPHQSMQNMPGPPRVQKLVMTGYNPRTSQIIFQPMNLQPPDSPHITNTQCMETVPQAKLDVLCDINSVEKLPQATSNTNQPTIVLLPQPSMASGMLLKSGAGPSQIPDHNHSPKVIKQRKGRQRKTPNIIRKRRRFTQKEGFHKADNLKMHPIDSVVISNSQEDNEELRIPSRDDSPENSVGLPSPLEELGFPCSPAVEDFLRTLSEVIPSPEPGNRSITDAGANFLESVRKALSFDLMDTSEPFVPKVPSPVVTPSVSPVPSFGLILSAHTLSKTVPSSSFDASSEKSRSVKANQTVDKEEQASKESQKSTKSGPLTVPLSVSATSHCVAADTVKASLTMEHVDQLGRCHMSMDIAKSDGPAQFKATEVVASVTGEDLDSDGRFLCKSCNLVFTERVTWIRHKGNFYFLIMI